MCNEAFESTPFVEQCRTLKNAGYEGIEIAPFTLAPDPVDITPEQRNEYRRIMREEGLEFVGLHWLMVSPKGLHVTTPDKALRDRSWGHIRKLIDLCADLGDNGVMVFGSPQQRSTTGGSTRAGSHSQLHRRSGGGRAAGRGARRHRSGGSAAGCAVRRGPDPGRSGCHRARRSTARPSRPCSTRTTRWTKPSRTRRWSSVTSHFSGMSTSMKWMAAIQGLADYDFAALFETLIRLDYRALGFAGSFRFQAGRGGDRAAVDYLSQTTMNGKCVVTGGAGFIGSALVRGLLNAGTVKWQ